MWPFSHYPDLQPQKVGVSVPFTAESLLNATYDYIIVGGGTAGCCIASRLSEDPRTSVLVLERGGVADTWVSKVPLLSANPHGGSQLFVEWPSTPMPHVNNRVLDIARGEGVGGTSRVNAMLYTRGAPSEYNNWKSMGHRAWGYDDLQPYFVKSETSLSQPSSVFRGTKGPWENQTFVDLPFPFLHHVKPAAASLGIPSVPDINSPKAPPAVCGTLDVAIDHNMYRASTFSAFLPRSLAIARSGHLKICTYSVATRIDIEEEAGHGLRAKGVYFERAKSSTEVFYVRARKEVIICCGALGSPQLLMLSGVGPAAHLQQHGIRVIRDMSGVGSNLKDHLDVPLTFEAPLDETMHLLLEKPWYAAIELVKYLLLGKGLFSTPFVQMAIFVKTSLLNDNMEIGENNASGLDPTHPDNIPDIEIKPIAINCSPILTKNIGVVSLLTCLMSPKSFGSVRLTSQNPRDYPAVDLGFLTNAHDYTVIRKGIKLSLRLAEQMRSQGYPLKNIQVPVTENDDDIDKYVREQARTTYHYTSTCRMAPETDELRPGVVDDELRVHGIGGLRVCDASIFPEIIAAHTMAPVVVVAEKCADMLKAAAT